MKKNDVVELTITGYGNDGEGVARGEDGRVVFVKGALRGERCRVTLMKVGKTAAWGRLSEVMEPSPARRTPDCPYYPRCGGCQLRHMSYEEELEFKRQKVEECLHRLGGQEFSVSVIHGAADTSHYRNKSQFPVSDGPGGLRLGFYRSRSHEVIDVDSCRLQSEGADRIRRAVKEWMEAYHVPAYDEKEGTGLIRHVYVRSNRRGEALACIVANGSRLPREKELPGRILAAWPKTVGVVLGVNRRQTNVILGEEYRTLWGQDWLEDRMCGMAFRLSVPSFYQINTPQAEVLYRRAVELAGLSGRETVLDLYCGAGTITLAMARRAKQAIGAEIVPEAVENAKGNAAANGVKNARFFLGDAGEVAGKLVREQLHAQVVVVDPPRKGLSQEVIDAIVQIGPERVVYVSCDPATLGRDVKRLAGYGYELCQAEAVDLFPRTAHVETVVLLSKGEIDSRKVRAEFSVEDIGMSEFEKGAAYSEQ